MCGRYGFVSPKDESEVWERYELQNKPKTRTTYNLAPTMKGLIVDMQREGKEESFGWKAPWGGLLLNSKSETAASLPSFARLFRESRVIIPASFFYEWQKHEDKTKTPFCIKVKDTNMFSFAGLFNEKENAFTILTTRPNSLMEKIHNRQPCILTEESEEDWLNPDKEPEQLMELLEPFPASQMEAYEVSSLVNVVKNQGAELIKPI